MPYRLDVPTVPNLHVAGYWDQEDFYGPLKAYEVLEKKDTRNQNFIVINHFDIVSYALVEPDMLKV